MYTGLSLVYLRLRLAALSSFAFATYGIWLTGGPPPGSALMSFRVRDTVRYGETRYGLSPCFFLSFSDRYHVAYLTLQQSPCPLRRFCTASLSIMLL